MKDDPKSKFVTLTPCSGPTPSDNAPEKNPPETRSDEEETAERTVKISKFRT
jgi:hypothetical protein